MVILDSLARMGATLLGIVHTRVELLSVEIEEELRRFASFLLWSLVALFCAAMAVFLIIILLIAAFWDTHRIAVLLSLFAVFSVSATTIAIKLRNAVRYKPRLLASSLAELRRDRRILDGEE